MCNGAFSFLLSDDVVGFEPVPRRYDAVEVPTDHRPDTIPPAEPPCARIDGSSVPTYSSNPMDSSEK